MCHRRFGATGEGRRGGCGEDGSYVLRESPAPYNSIFRNENVALRPENAYFRDHNLRISIDWLGPTRDLGKALVLEFTSLYLPEELDQVSSIFRRKGAYSRYKDLLERKGALEDWYQFEEERRGSALKEWCQENHIELEG
jgi:hypothetical protein